MRNFAPNAFLRRTIPSKTKQKTKKRKGRSACFRHSSSVFFGTFVQHPQPHPSEILLSSSSKQPSFDFRTTLRGLLSFLPKIWQLAKIHRYRGISTLSKKIESCIRYELIVMQSLPLSLVLPLDLLATQLTVYSFASWLQIRPLFSFSVYARRMHTFRWNFQQIACTFHTRFLVRFEGAGKGCIISFRKLEYFFRILFCRKGCSRNLQKKP